MKQNLDPGNKPTYCINPHVVCHIQQSHNNFNGQKIISSIVGVGKPEQLHTKSPNLEHYLTYTKINSKLIKGLGTI